MKKILLAAMLTLAMTTGSAFAQMMGSGQHMMDAAQQPQAQQGSQPYYGMMGYGMYPGMISGYGMHPGMMGGYGMPMPMMGYGMMPMYQGMMGYGTTPCMSGYGMHQPMMGYGMGYGMHPGMMGGYGMPHMYPGTGGDLEKQREFLKETSKLRKKLHDLMFEHMEAQWQADTKPEELEKLGKEIRGLQQELHEKSREALK
jgi:hypothetical protein